MFNPDNRDEGQQPRSLLSFGQGVKKPASGQRSASLVSLVPEGPSAAERHRQARQRREAAPSPLLGALARAEESSSAGARTGAADEAPPRRAGRPIEKPVRDPSTVSGLQQSSPEDIYRSADAMPAPTSSISGSGSDQWRPLIDPWKIWNGIVRSRWIILASTVAGAMLGVAVALSTPKKYESVAELLVDPRDIKISDRNVMEGGLPSDATLAIVENQVKVLTSGNVLSKVVDKLNLASDPEFNGQEEGFGLGAAISSLRSLFSSGAAGEGDVRRSLAIRNLAESLDVERGGKTFVVSIAAKTRSPDKSALIANTLTSTFLDSYGELQSNTAGRASDELSARLAELQKSVEESERKVEAFKAENDLIDAQGRLITDDEIVKLNDQLSIARARTIELNARAASAKDLNPDAIVGGSLPEQISSPVMAELRTQYATAKQEVDRLSVRLGPRHPERMAAEAQLAGARDSLAAELRRISSSIQVDLRRAVQLEQDLASRLAQLKSRQGNVSDDLVTLRELERESAAKRAVYESFLLRARETDEQRGINTANMSVISVATPPLDPLGPSRAVIAIAGAVLGFAAGVGIGGARGAIDSLRGEGGNAPPRPSRQPAHRAPSPSRRDQDDEIDRIMRAAATQVTSARPLEPTPPAPVVQSAPPAMAREPDPTRDPPPPETAKPDTRPGANSKETIMHQPPAYPYAAAPGAYPAQPMPSQPWINPQAAYAAHQQAAYQAWVAAQQAAYAAPMPYPQPVHATPYFAPPMPAQPVYPAMHMPVNMQAPQPWPGQPQFTHQPAWPSAEAAFRQNPAPQQQASPRAARQEQSALDEIRDNLREFREALRDLVESRTRGRI